MSGWVRVGTRKDEICVGADTAVGDQRNVHGADEFARGCKGRACEWGPCGMGAPGRSLVCSRPPTNPRVQNGLEGGARGRGPEI